MAILGQDIFPIQEMSQHEKEVLHIISCLESVRRKMEENRADDLEILLYQTYLLYQASLGGSIGMEKNDYRQTAFDIVDSLWRFSADLDSDGVGPLEDPFLSPQFSRDIYIEAFHELLNSNYFKYVELGNEYSLCPYDGPDSFLSLTIAIKSFLSPIIKRNGVRILDCNASYLHPDYSFEDVSQYVIYEQNNVFYAFLVLRKELEGDAWNKVVVINQLNPDLGLFDCILYGQALNSHYLPNDYSDYWKRLNEDGVLVIHSAPFNRDDSANLISLGSIETVISFIEIGEDRHLYILRKKDDYHPTVTFAEFGLSDGKQSVSLFKNNTINDYSRVEPDRIISVPQAELLKGNLFPAFYLLLRETRMNGGVPLKSLVSPSISRTNTIPAERIGDSAVVQNISTDTRLLETTYDFSFKPERGYYYFLEKTAILISRKRWIIGYIQAEPGRTVFINDSIYAFPVDTERVDIRYLVLQLRKNKYFETAIQFANSENDILELYIPLLSLSEQRQCVEDYLRELRNEFNSRISIKENNLQLLVFTPDNAEFENSNKEKIHKLGLIILEYIEDKNALKLALAEHYGENVLSSNLADAVIICADLPVTDVQKAMYFVSKTGIRAFYYSNNPSFDSSVIDEDYLDDFHEGYIPGKDYLESIRFKLDADSNKIKERYPKFFSAADHLDQDFNWGLTEFATDALLSNPFKLDINKLRSKIDETVISYFKNHHIAPVEMDNSAVASLIADRKYYEGRKKVNISLTEELPKAVLDSESWLKYALVALRKLGNKDSHSSKNSDSSIELAAFTLFTEIVIWLDSVKERYKDKKCLFTIKKGNTELPFYTVESHTLEDKEYLLANGVHVIDNKHELESGDQVVILGTEKEKYPKTIDGIRVEEMANSNNYMIVIKG